MKKFDQPFDSYQIGPRVIDVELDSKAFKNHKDLLANPIYYFHAFQYRNGFLYRAIFGYENVWDKDFENDLTRRLDKYLAKLDETGFYYFENIKFLWPTKLHALPWKRGIKPNPLQLKERFPYWVKGTPKALARINRMDKPAHVDIEFESGDVVTISYAAYRELVGRRVVRRPRNAKRQPHEPQPEQAGAHEKNGQCREAESAEGAGSCLPLGKVASQLLGVRQRLRRLNSM